MYIKRRALLGFGASLIRVDPRTSSGTTAYAISPTPPWW